MEVRLVTYKGIDNEDLGMFYIPKNYKDDIDEIFSQAEKHAKKIEKQNDDVDLFDLIVEYLEKNYNIYRIYFDEVIYSKIL